jgi:uncharacterized membrane-anchored protein
MAGKTGLWPVFAFIVALASSNGLGAWEARAASSESQSAGAEAQPTAAETAQLNKIKAVLASLHPIEGTVAIPEAQAQFRLGSQYYFLSAADAKKVVTDVWGNPPAQAENVLGMILPANGNPATTWGAVITFAKSGYVSDSDASSTDYSQYIKQIQDGEANDNAERKKNGYPTSHLVGWAQPPSYDKASHSMIWARDLQFSGLKDDTLNYDVRVLGRNGVLSVNLVDSMSNLAAIREQARQLALAGGFLPGARYEDYKPGVDQKAAYGLAGLVAAGVGVAVAKKLGLLALILAFGKKAIVVILAAGAAVARWFGSIFGGKKKKAARAQAALADMPAPDAPPVADTQHIAEFPES